ncbi:calcium/sodium antiporter [Paracoccus sp. NSM]|uniref:calcium/sodium antiporter n=1 Tax=Paracoccus sp. NSM TaxID=3457784 RepID=UPI0040360814
MIVDILFVVAGLALLVFGGDMLVKGAVNLSLRLGITPLVVGLTVVAFGTSAPEMIVSLSAAWRGATDLALGNVVGSNIANVLVILGATAIFSPIVTRGHDLRESWTMMMAASVLLIGLAYFGSLGRIDGMVLLAVLALIIWRQLSTARPEDVEEIEGAALGARWKQIILWLVLGLVLLPVGADLLVRGATDIARAFGVTEVVIGLTLVAIGTSLPELAASVAAALRGRSDMALGNVVGSNIFNILSILGVTALFAPLPIPSELMRFDLWVMLASSALLAPFLFRALTIGRVTGALFLAAYAAYAWVLL